MSEQPRTAHRVTGPALLALVAVVIAASAALVYGLGQRARSQQCRGNLQMLSVALLMYTNDFDSRLPLAGSWVAGIEPYVKSTAPWRCPSAGAYGLNARVAGRRVYLGLPVPPPNGLRDSAGPVLQWCLRPGQTVITPWAELRATFPDSSGAMPLGVVEPPPTTIVLFESPSPSPVAGGLDELAQRPPHRGWWQFAMADGHVQRAKQTGEEQWERHSLSGATGEVLKMRVQGEALMDMQPREAANHELTWVTEQGLRAALGLYAIPVEVVSRDGDAQWQVKVSYDVGAESADDYVLSGSGFVHRSVPYVTAEWRLVCGDVALHGAALTYVGRTSPSDELGVRADPILAAARVAAYSAATQMLCEARTGAWPSGLRPQSSTAVATLRWVQECLTDDTYTESSLLGVLGENAYGQLVACPLAAAAAARDEAALAVLAQARARSNDLVFRDTGGLLWETEDELTWALEGYQPFSPSVRARLTALSQLPEGEGYRQMVKDAAQDALGEGP